MMNRRLITLITLLVVVFGCGKKVKDKGPEAEALAPELVSEEYLQYVNGHREKLGLLPLEKINLIEELSAEHSREMALKKRPYGHFGKATRCKKIKDIMGGDQNLCGEIVASGADLINAKAVFSLWMNSPLHRQVIEASHFTHTGIGFHADEDGDTYWTQMFYALPN